MKGGVIVNIASLAGRCKHYTCSGREDKGENDCDDNYYFGGCVVLVLGAVLILVMMMMMIMMMMMMMTADYIDAATPKLLIWNKMHGRTEKK